MVDVFRGRNFELLALIKMKLKGNREISWCGVNGIITGVQEMEKAREGMGILTNDMWHNAIIDLRMC